MAKTGRVSTIRIKVENAFTDVRQGDESNPTPKDILPLNFIVVEEVQSPFISGNVSYISPANVESREH